MRINVEVDEKTLRKLVLQFLEQQTGLDLTENDVRIEVKSKQNYKSEWELAAFRATVEKYVI